MLGDPAGSGMGRFPLPDCPGVFMGSRTLSGVRARKALRMIADWGLLRKPACGPGNGSAISRNWTTGLETDLAPRTGQVGSARSHARVASLGRPASGTCGKIGAVAVSGNRCRGGFPRKAGRMIEFEFYVQEAHVPEALWPELASAVETVCHDVLGPEQGPVAIAWTVVRDGYGFRGGRPSTTSLVRGRIPDGCDRATRSRLLKALGAAWCRVAGATPEEVIVSARDRSWSG